MRKQQKLRKMNLKQEKLENIFQSKIEAFDNTILTMKKIRKG